MLIYSCTPIVLFLIFPLVKQFYFNKRVFLYIILIFAKIATNTRSNFSTLDVFANTPRAVKILHFVLFINFIEKLSDREGLASLFLFHELYLNFILANFQLFWTFKKQYNMIKILKRQILINVNYISSFLFYNKS